MAIRSMVHGCTEAVLSLRHVDELLAARGVAVSRETVRWCGLRLGQGSANQIRRRLPGAGGTRHPDEVAVRIAGVPHRLRRLVDQDASPLRRTGVLDSLV